MSDKERNDVPSQIDWLARFTSKVGLGACICEGQEISAAIDEIERLTAERDELLTRLDLESGTVGMIDRECADLRRQLDECSQMLARQAATIRELTRPAEE